MIWCITCDILCMLFILKNSYSQDEGAIIFPASESVTNNQDDVILFTLKPEASVETDVSNVTIVANVQNIKNVPDVSNETAVPEVPEVVANNQDSSGPNVQNEAAPATVASDQDLNVSNVSNVSNVQNTSSVLIETAAPTVPNEPNVLNVPDGQNESNLSTETTAPSVQSVPNVPVVFQEPEVPSAPEVPSVPRVSPEYEKYFKLSTDPWKNFWLDLRQYYNFVKYIAIVDYNSGPKEFNNKAASWRLKDFKTRLIMYINNNYASNIVMTTSEQISAPSKTPTNITIPNAVYFVSDIQLIFSIYNSLEDIRFSLLNDTLYKNKLYKRSYYVFVVLDLTIQGVACDSSELINSIKETTGSYFERLWSSLGILECLILFPGLCGNEILLKYNFIDTHKSKNFSDGVVAVTKKDCEKNPQALLHNYENFKKYPLKVNMFLRIPTMVKSMPFYTLESYLGKDIKNVNNLGGMDGFVLGNVVNRLKFHPIILNTTDPSEYGYKKTDGTFSGSLKDIIQRTMDISFNARFIKTYGSNAIEFTLPVYYDQFCILAPKSSQIPHWLSIFLVFNPMVWMIIIGGALLTGVIWWIMKKRFPEEGAPKNNYSFFALVIDMLLMVVSAPIVLPTIFRERLFITFCMIFNLIIAGVFQGYLSTAYSTISYYSDINSLEELDNTGLTISTKNVDIFGTNITRIGTNLSKKIRANTRDSMKAAATKKNTTVVERRTDALMVISMNFTTPSGEPLLHIVNECPRSYHLAYIVYKDFPLLPHINRVLLGFNSAGLTFKWYSDTITALLLKSRLNTQSEEVLKKLTLFDVQASFICLSCGYALAIAVFFYEIFSYYCMRCVRNIKNRRGKRRGEVVRVATSEGNIRKYPFIY